MARIPGWEFPKASRFESSESNAPMKILFLNTYDDPADGGGVELTVWTLIRALKEKGHECILVSTQPGRALDLHEREGVRIWRAGIRNLYWPTKEKIASSLSKLAWHTVDGYSRLMQSHLKQVLELEKPDVVSVHSLPGWSASSWATIRSLSIPIVQVLHDQYAICARSSMFRNEHNCEAQCTDCKLLRLPHRKASSLPSAVIGVSQFILDRHLQHGYFQGVPIKAVINNTRNPQSLDVGALTPEHKGIRFGFIGRLDPSKGVEILLQAFSRFEHEDAQLWIAGDGDQKYVAALKKQTKDVRVKFLGRVKQRDFFPEVDAVVVPSLWNDTFPGVVFEALAFGKPVLGSLRGGIPEMIQHGQNGFLFEPDNDGELLSLLNQVASNPEERIAMGAAARVSSRPFMDTEAWLDKYLALYAQLGSPA